MDSGVRPPAAREHLVCGVCPSLAMELGRFDVAPRPSPESSYLRQRGYRVDRASGVPVCAPGAGRAAAGGVRVRAGAAAVGGEASWAA